MSINKNHVFDGYYFWKTIKSDWQKAFHTKKEKKENGDILDISDLGFQVCIGNDVNIQ